MILALKAVAEDEIIAWRLGETDRTWLDRALRQEDGMVDEGPGAPAQPQFVIKPAQGIPPASIPTVFADGVANLAPTSEIMKFYLYRSDPDILAKPEYQNQVVAQIIMPLSAFVEVALFFERALQSLVSRGLVSNEMLASIKEEAASRDKPTEQLLSQLEKLASIVKEGAASRSS